MGEWGSEVMEAETAAWRRLHLLAQVVGRRGHGGRDWTWSVLER